MGDNKDDETPVPFIRSSDVDMGVVKPPAGAAVLLGRAVNFVPVNSSTGAALRLFRLDPVENPDLSVDLLNLEQQAFDKQRVLLRTYVDNPRMTSDQIGLKKGQADEEHSRSVVADVLKRRDATESGATQTTDITFKFVLSIIKIWFANLFAGS